MIGTLRKHSTILWIFIIAVVIVAFVFWGAQGPGGGGDGRGGNLGSVDGERVTIDAYNRARTEVALRYFFTTGAWPNQDRRRQQIDLNRETYFRLFLLKKLKDYNIQVSTEAVAKMARDILSNAGPNGQPVALNEFVRQHLHPNASSSDFERFLRHDVGIQQLINLTGLTGEFVTQEEVRGLFEQNHRPLVTEAVFFSGTNYMSEATDPTPEELESFYQMRGDMNYRIPEKMQVSYVVFPISNHLAEAEARLTNLTDLVDMNLDHLGTNFTFYGETREEARETIRKRLIEREAASDVQRQAIPFLNELFSIQPVRSQNLAQLAQSKGLEVHVTEPFELEVGPDFEGGINFAQAAARLTDEDPFAEQPVLTPTGLNIIALERRIPSQLPPLDQVREQVVADFKEVQAAQAARRAGSEFARMAAQGLEAGKTFPEICLEAGVRRVSVPPFSATTESLPEIEEHMGFNQYQRIAFSTPVESVSDLSPTADGGVVVFVKERLPVDPQKVAEELPAFVESLRQRRRNEAFSAWFSREASKALSDVPGLRDQPGGNS